MIKLRILRWYIVLDYLRGALNAIANVFLSEERAISHRRGKGDVTRDWSDVVGQGIQAATNSWNILRTSILLEHSLPAILILAQGN